VFLLSLLPLVDQLIPSCDAKHHNQKREPHLLLIKRVEPTLPISTLGLVQSLGWLSRFYHFVHDQLLVTLRSPGEEVAAPSEPGFTGLPHILGLVGFISRLDLSLEYFKAFVSIA